MEITKLPAKILKQKLSEVPVEKIKAGDFASLVEEMHKDMLMAKGVGLAANQVGQNLMLFVIDKKLAQENGISNAFFNPEITEYSKEADEMEEGCLSIPEYYTPIRRAKKIKIKAVNEHGSKVKFKARGFLARVLQHETDHLNGYLIKDRASG